VDQARFECPTWGDVRMFFDDHRETLLSPEVRTALDALAQLQPDNPNPPLHRRLLELAVEGHADLAFTLFETDAEALPAIHGAIGELVDELGVEVARSLAALVEAAWPDAISPADRAILRALLQVLDRSADAADAVSLVQSDALRTEFTPDLVDEWIPVITQHVQHFPDRAEALTDLSSALASLRPEDET